MTTPELQQHALAKANLTAVLLRADPTPVSKDAISQFHTLLDTTLTTCSPPNIQVAHHHHQPTPRLFTYTAPLLLAAN